MNAIRCTDASDRSVLITFLAIPPRPLTFFHSLQAHPPRGITNLHPAYGSLLIEFDPLCISHAGLRSALEQRLATLNADDPAAPRTITIPLCYGGEFGPDLAEVARLHDLSTEDVIDLHASTDYSVHFLGFVPGFAYLGTLPVQLATPRLPTPRKRVEPASLGIADRQTGIYPFPTPGGWRLIGRTPRQMFDPARQSMSLLEPGDRVRFEPISPERFHELS